MGGEPMTFSIRAIDPVSRAVLRRRGLRHRHHAAAVACGCRGDLGRHGSVRRAGVPRPALHRRDAARVQPQLRRAGAGDRRHRAGPRAPAVDGRQRHLQPRQEQPVAGARRPAAAVRSGQPAVALGQFVQGGAGEVFAAVGAAHPIGGRQHGVRRHARGVRCAGRGDQGGVREPDLRAQPVVLAQHPGVHRLHRRRDGASSHRSGSVWCAAIR